MKRTVKRIISVVLAVSVIAAMCAILSGCGEDKKNTAPTSAAQAATQASQAPAAEITTLAPDATQAQTPAAEEATEAPATNVDSSPYAGIDEQSAVQNAVDFAGSGYMAVSTEQRFFRNQEAWYVGLTAVDGGDGNVYYVYVTATDVIPQQEIPAITSVGDGDAEEQQ